GVPDDSGDAYLRALSSDEIQLSPQKGKIKIQLTYYYWLTTPSLSRISAVLRSSVLLHPVICFTISL
ncbi:MAG: hypothetical protein ACLFVI_00425, partial [Archaeoglobaceae archaeon]